MADIQNKARMYTSTKGGLLASLRLSDYNIPATKPNHIQIEVLNVSLNPGDLKFPDVPIVGRLITRPASPCFDFCGRIRVLPAGFVNDSRKLAAGQVVFGIHRDLKTLGTLKTLMWVQPDSVYLCQKIYLWNMARLWGTNGKVLINGGAGGVGTFSIQIAKALGMYVIATCSEAGAQLCRDLGADEILDYKATGFRDDLSRTKVDLVVDKVGNDPDFHRRSETFLKADGQFVLVALMDRDWAGVKSMLVSWLCPAWLGGPSRKWRAVFTQSKVSDFEPVTILALKNKLKVVVGSTFSFDEVPRAFEKLKTGRAKGKIMVKVNDD